MWESLLLSDDLNPTETLLVIGVGMHDWGDGRGGWPSNATLARFCKLDTTTEDRGQRCVRRLIAGVAAKGYLEVRKAARTRANPTGRVITLLPKATGQPCPADPDIQVRCTEATRTYKSAPPGHTSPRHPDIQVRGIDPLEQTQETDDDPGVEVVAAALSDEAVEAERARFDEATDRAMGRVIVAGRIGPRDAPPVPPVRVEGPPVLAGSPPPPVADQVVAPTLPVDALESLVRNLEDYARRYHGGDGDKAPKVSKAVRRWVGILEGHTTRPEFWVRRTIEKVDDADQPKRAVQFATSCLERWVLEGKVGREDRGSATAKAGPIVADPGAEVERIKRLKAEGSGANEGALRTRWESLPAGDRDAIEAAVLEANPHARKFAGILAALCIDAMKARDGSDS